MMGLLFHRFNGRFPGDCVPHQFTSGTSSGREPLGMRRCFFKHSTWRFCDPANSFNALNGTVNVLSGSEKFDDILVL